MALPVLVGGADCGPANPLLGLSKELDRDRGLQQDQFGAGRAGSSKQAFRSQYAAAPGADQDAARFFAAGPSNTTTGPYDLSALHTSLPSLHAQSPVQSPPAAAAPWAADFLQHTQQMPHRLDADQQSAQSRQPVQTPVDPGLLGSPFAARAQWTPGAAAGFALNVIPYQPATSTAQIQQPAAHVDAQQWELAFQSHTSLPSTETAQEQRPAARIEDPDELARAAGSLIDAVRHEQNPKFQNSAFLGLMKQLRDREVVIDGDQMVPADVQADAKGKGRAVYEHPITSSMLPQADDRQYGGERVPEEAIDEYLRQENDAYIEYMHAPAVTQSTALQGEDWEHFQDACDRFEASRAGIRPLPTGPFTAHNPYLLSSTSAPRRSALYDSVLEMEAAVQLQGTDWDRLQNDWDRFEASATGIRPLANYPFTAHNPYLLGEPSLQHPPERNTLYDSVLEMEAAVQRAPHDAHAWFALGVRQQENEREGAAVHALRRALELQPALLPAWLALAVAHTNEGSRAGAHEAIRAWVAHNARYAAAVEAYRAEHPEREDASQKERFDGLVGCLIAMARSEQGGEVDADIQIALAVLMNTNEAYEKARDCFTTALAVRPDDWQLYNRVGATLANSGRAAEALEYYYRALELNPAYIRARFNLGISCINLRRYGEASQHILDALALQESDSVTEPDGNENKRGITSSALWGSLKTCCLHLGRLDLATICDLRDLEAFQLNFNLR